ncbi:hypothetical protein, partial [Marinobacter sp.]|uniref:hypothetical protein n=1 Tax=Marinobacter sp. TaxID=50741 RepID=UPI003A8E23DC
MRLLVQGCLILGLCLFASAASANWVHQTTLCVYGPNPCDQIDAFLSEWQSKGVPAYVGPGYTSY